MPPQKPLLSFCVGLIGLLLVIVTEVKEQTSSSSFLSTRFGCGAFTAIPTINRASSTRQIYSSSPLFSSLMLPDSVFDTIHQGGIAIVDDFLSPTQIARLRQDAQQLYQQPGVFITDSLAGYGQQAAVRDKAQFDPRKDRAVCPAYIPSKGDQPGPFVSPTLGDSAVRNQLCGTIGQLRTTLAKGLDRPGMDTDQTAVLNRHEVSYTRFGPGAYLKRHTDEHHEELKGTKGWSKPSRRSLSWLIYLNEPDWSPTQDGGMLRTFPRLTGPSHTVGARQGDLQIGWLAPTREDPVERPVFLDGRRAGESGNCALYMDNPTATTKSNEYERLYLTQNFLADPYLFLSTDWVVQYVLMGKTNPALGKRFHYVEPPKSALTEYFNQKLNPNGNLDGEGVLDVAPTEGTLVMFDSVALPHQVMPTMTRERWAISGWFHEAQQDIPKQEQLFLLTSRYQSSNINNIA